MSGPYNSAASNRWRRIARESAALSNNEQARRLAALEEAQLHDTGASPTPLELLAELPADHPVAHVMVLSALAETLLTHGERYMGERLLRRAFEEAKRLGYRHEVEKSTAIAERFGLSLTENEG